MENYNNDLNNINEILKSVNGVKEHLNTRQVKLGKEILKKRIELNISHYELVQYCFKYNLIVDELIISKIELGQKNIDIKFYEKILKIMEVIENEI